MMIVFFNIQSMVYAKWIPKSRTANRYYYIEVLACFLKTKIGFVEEQILHSSSEKSAISLHFVCQGIFSAKYRITVLGYPPYSPNVAFCYLLSFLNIKLDLKGIQFKNVEAIKVKSVEIFKFILENYQPCFIQ